MGTRGSNGRPPPLVVEPGWDEWAELVTAGDRAGPWVTLNHMLALNTPWSRGKDGSPDPWNLALVVELLGPNQELFYWLPSFAEVGAVVDSLAHLGVTVPGGPPVEPKVVADPAERDAVVRGLRYSRLIVARVLRPPRGPDRAGDLPPIHLVVEFLDPLGGIRYWRPTPLSVGSVRSALKWIYRWNVENDAEGRRRRGLDPSDGPQSPWAAARRRPPRGRNAVYRSLFILLITSRYNKNK